MTRRLPSSSKARSSPVHKIQALYQAGLSFEANNALKLADRSYREALKTLDPEDKENFNALHYRLGRVAEALGNNEVAEEHYNEVPPRLRLSRRRERLRRL